MGKIELKSRENARQGLSPGDFRSLLNRLGKDPQEAADRYELLRRKIIKFFVWEQCGDAESLADECLDRVARKLEEGVEIQNLSGYLSGVARIVVKEYQARRQRENTVLENFSYQASVASTEENLEVAVTDLNHCLDQFSVDQRRLILRYYEGDHAKRIENRKKLADELGILPNALRNRAMRLRAILEACMAGRQGQRDRSAAGLTIDRDAGK